MRVTTASDGSFVLTQFPQVSTIQVKIQADGLATVKVGWNPPEPITITLDRRSGRLVGRFKLPDRYQLEGSSTVGLTRIRRPGNPSTAQKFWIYDSPRAAVDRDGRFRFEGVLPGQYILVPDLDPSTPFLAVSDGSHPIKVEPGATAEAPEVQVAPTVTVTGRVLDAETEKGIEGVSVSGYAFNPQRGLTAATKGVRTDVAPVRLSGGYEPDTPSRSQRHADLSSPTPLADSRDDQWF